MALGRERSAALGTRKSLAQSVLDIGVDTTLNELEGRLPHLLGLREPEKLLESFGVLHPKENLLYAAASSATLRIPGRAV